VDVVRAERDAAVGMQRMARGRQARKRVAAMKNAAAADA
jgi:hypothetical protein